MGVQRAARGAVSSVSSSISIAAAPAEVWDYVMDPQHLGDWVTIHRRLHSADDGAPRVGFRMRQQIHLRGVSIDVSWKLTRCEPARLAVWEGRGPARSRARTEYRLSAEDGGTRFDYTNEFRPPLGPIGALVSRALVGGVPEREAMQSLVTLRQRLSGLTT